MITLFENILIISREKNRSGFQVIRRMAEPDHAEIFVPSPEKLQALPGDRLFLLYDISMVFRFFGRKIELRNYMLDV